MKIKLSKSQWEQIGQAAGWVHKESQVNQNQVKFSEIKILVRAMMVFLSSFNHLEDYAKTPQLAIQLKTVMAQLQQASQFLYSVNVLKMETYQNKSKEILNFAYYLIKNVKPFFNNSLDKSKAVSAITSLDDIENSYRKVVS